MLTMNSNLSFTGFISGYYRTLALSSQQTSRGIDVNKRSPTQVDERKSVLTPKSGTAQRRQGNNGASVHAHASCEENVCIRRNTL